MKEFECENASQQQHAIDLMVDGELDEHSQRELLTALDHTTDGWRHLALAFVEARTLEKELRAWVAVDSPTGAAVQPRRVRRSISKSLFALALASSFLLAFGVAFIWRGQFHSGGADNRETTEQLVGNESLWQRPSVVPPSPDKHRQDPETEIAPSAAPENIVTNLQPAIEVPVLAAGGGIHHPGDRSALPGHVVEFLQRYGYHVESQRKYRSVELSDGRHVVIPIEQVDVQFMGTQPFQ